jgi:uncharacterized damage-inducible protein DinB
MGTTSEIFRALLDYHYALYRRVWDSIGHLTEAQFVADTDYGHGSIRNQIVHVATVDLRWIRGLQGQPGARQLSLDPLDYGTRQAARELWDRTEREVTDYVAALDDRDLAQRPPGMGGPAWQVLAHVVNHGTDHRAQILRLLDRYGAPTFDQDLILHLWAR